VVSAVDAAADWEQLMAIAFVQNATNASATPQLTGVAAGDFLTLQLFYILTSSGSATPTISDSSGQTWNADQVPTPQGGTGDWVGVANFSLPNAAAGTHTITTTLAGSLVVAYGMAEWSGMPTVAALDSVALGLTGSTTAGVQTMTVSAGAATTQASELIIVAMAIETNSGASAAITSPPSGFTNFSNVVLNNTWQGSDFGYQSAYETLSSTGTPSATWNWTGTGTNRSQGTLVPYKGATGKTPGLMLSSMGVG
jgi:hypothetical protein